MAFPETVETQPGLLHFGNTLINTHTQEGRTLIVAVLALAYLTHVLHWSRSCRMGRSRRKAGLRHHRWFGDNFGRRHLVDFTPLKDLAVTSEELHGLVKVRQFSMIHG